ncbi:MAG: 6-pyruvoyl-tetrahydropterin synthase-related protein [Candidatus Daviesbacteria bacterium]|nr:6-pyruvoyl-tetrahydropterin synthase-related protein [Candidatus Daviesbacteria bacterium]
MEFKQKVFNILKNNWQFWVGFVLTSSLLWPLCAAPLFSHHDDTTIIRLYEMDKCIKDGQIPCRWVPDLGNLYGYPLFNYYAPLPYYFGEIFYFLSGNLIFSVKIMFVVSFLGAYVFMYLFGAKFWGKLGGSLSAIFYSFAPYHGLDFYVRGAMGEMWALMFFPLVVYLLIRLKDKLSILNSLLLATSVALLITSHNLSAMIFLPIVFLLYLLLFIEKKQIKFLLYGFAAFLIGIFLSSFYLLPVLVERDLVHVETTTYGYFSYTEHFKGFKKLFLERDWGYGASVREIPGGERDRLSYQIGWVHLLGWILALVGAYILRKKEKRVSLIIIVSSFIIALAVFMVNPRSIFIWQAVEPLKYLQFPWRFLLIIIFLASFISGAVFLILKDQVKQKLIWLILVILVVTLNFSYFRPEKFIQTSDEDLLTGSNWERQIKRAILDYLPKSASEPPAELARERYQLLTGDSFIYDFKQGSNWFSFKTNTNTHTIIRLSQYYFPKWKIFIDGKETLIDYKNNSLGLMTIILGEGNHIVEGRLYDTPIRTIANLLTSVSALIVVIFLLLHIPITRSWIKYYKERIA